jgi:hypothetical protein
MLIDIALSIPSTKDYGCPFSQAGGVELVTDADDTKIQKYPVDVLVLYE